MPTAFVAEYGSGKPVIGILAEYDALPELSQQVTGDPQAGRRAASTGHGCGHCALGTAAVGAALAVKEVYDKHKLKGTIRVYGTPAEETLIGKVYMALDGQFDDLDACLHWHPGTQEPRLLQLLEGDGLGEVHLHRPAGPRLRQPRQGPQRPRRRRADERRRQLHARAHQGRRAASTTSSPTAAASRTSCRPTAQVWYYVRANAHEDVEAHFDWLKDIADGAAKMSRTKVQVQIDTDCHEIIPNLPLSKVI